MGNRNFLKYRIKAYKLKPHKKVKISLVTVLNQQNTGVGGGHTTVLK